MNTQHTLLFFSFLLIFSAFSTPDIHGQGFTPFGKAPLVHTYSIVAYDEKTGEMGVAVQSHWFSTGTIVIWGEAGIGVVATQSFVNPAFGPEGLSRLSKGQTPAQALAEMLVSDPGEGFRQVALLNAKGEVAAHTGSKCIDAAGHKTGKGYSVQANMMLNNTVWPAMASAFENSTGKPLEERLMLALEAAEAAGGDIRGKQSAAMLVVRAENTGKPWLDRRVDLRVDDAPNPLQELRRLLKVHKAYDHMNRGDLAIEAGKTDEAMQEYGAAEALFPKNLEMKYWHAVTLANKGRLQEALPLFRQVFKKDKNWKLLTPRLVPNGLLTVSKEDLNLILGKK